MNAPIEPRIWIKAVWGFDPINDSYLGFTREGNRERFITEYQPGDLVLVYGADSAETNIEARRQVLAFLEPGPIRIRDVDRLSEIGRLRKIEKGWQDRWTYALPVRRAWRVNRKIEIKHIAGNTLTHERARVIASRGELLTESEAAAARQLPVTAVSLFGETPVPESGEEHLLGATSYRTSRGINPTFGKREIDTEDGEHFLYLLRFEGDLAALLGQGRYDFFKKACVKIGYSNDPARRCHDLNSALPPAAIVRWKVALRSRAFPDGKSAKKAEDQLKSEFEKRFQSLGGEFFLGDEKVLDSLFAEATKTTAFRITAITAA